MVTLVKSVFTGGVVTGGGVSTLAFEDPVDDTAAATTLGWVRDFWTAIMAVCDEDITVQVQSNPSRYAAADGSLQGVFSASGGSALTGVVSGLSVPKAAQGLIRWGTAEVINRRMLRGRTFIPGLKGGAITDTGQLDAATQTALAAAANGLIADSGGVLSVWHRPVSDGEDPPVYSGGASHLVTSASVWEQYAVLRSRRD